MASKLPFDPTNSNKMRHSALIRIKRNGPREIKIAPPNHHFLGEVDRTRKGHRSDRTAGQ